MPLRPSRSAVLVLGLLAVTGCGGASGTSTPAAAPSPAVITEAPTSAAAVADSPTDAAASAADAAAAACERRVNNPPDIILRSTTPSGPYLAQQLGGGFIYNQGSGECQDAPTWALTTVADQPGYCGQVAEASDNPGYNTDAQPAPPLRKVIAAKGSC